MSFKDFEFGKLTWECSENPPVEDVSILEQIVTFTIAMFSWKGHDSKLVGVRNSLMEDDTAGRTELE